MSNSNPKRFQCDFTWTIQNFARDYGGDLIRGPYIANSPHFSAAEDTFLEWFLDLRTEKDLGGQRLKFHLVYIKLKEHRTIIGKFEYSFINLGEKKMDKHPIFFCSNCSQKWYFFIENFPPCVSSLYDMKCLHNDQLKIHCRVTYVRGIEMNSFFIDQPDPFKENYEGFLNNKELSDITIYVGDKEFPCHKIILATRSSVFKAMFTHDMKENSSNRVDIREIDENIFQQVLRYIYTGKVVISEATAFELLHAADMYHLADLKTLCENELGAMLAAENALKILSGSHTYHLENLKALAIEFIETHLNEIVDTDAWNDLKSQPDVMEILLRRFAELLR